MEALSGIPLTENTGETAVQLRKQILDHLRMGVTDMGLKIGRRGSSSLDTDLMVLEYMDILRILDENRKINKIILTSSSGRSSAFAWFRQYMVNKRVPVDFTITRLPFSGHFEYKGKKIEVKVVPSSSPAAAVSIGALVEIYKSEILV